MHDMEQGDIFVFGASGTDDSSQKRHFQNRIEVLKDGYTDDGSGRVDTGSLRFQFLLKLFADRRRKGKNFYVIEANESGAKVINRNFVVYSASQDEVNVDVYVYGIAGWFKQAVAKDIHTVVVDDASKNRVKFAKGFNYDDGIVFKFENNTVEYSDYYLYGTLSTGSGIKEILATNNLKNFIK
jgi:hypothetical protein